METMSLADILHNWRRYGLDYTTPFPEATDFLANGQVVCRHHRHEDVPLESWDFEGSVLTTRSLQLVGGLLDDFLRGREPVSLSLKDLKSTWDSLGGTFGCDRIYYDGFRVAEVVGDELISFKGEPLRSEVDLEDLMTSCEDLTPHEDITELVKWWESEGGHFAQNGLSISFIKRGISHLGDFWVPGTVAVWEADKMFMGASLLCAEGVKSCTLSELRTHLETSLREHPPQPEDRKSLEDYWLRSDGGTVDGNQLHFKGVKVCEWDEVGQIFKGPEGQKIWELPDFWDLLTRARKVHPEAPGLMATIREEWLAFDPYTEIYDGEVTSFLHYDDEVIQWRTEEALYKKPLFNSASGAELDGGLIDLQNILREYMRGVDRDNAIKEATQTVDQMKHLVVQRELDLKAAKLALEAAERRLSDLGG